MIAAAFWLFSPYSLGLWSLQGRRRVLRFFPFSFFLLLPLACFSPPI
jgi:hypothetical protein